jgi:leucyl aminopeptidase
MQNKKYQVNYNALIMLGTFLLQLCFPVITVQANPIPFDCSYDTQVEDLLNQTTQDTWSDWIRQLSGADPVTVNGESVTIATRYSFSLFDGSSNARAYDFVKETLLGWYNPEQIEEDNFNYNLTTTWKNLILTIPGDTNPEDIIIVSAHLDSRSENDSSSRILAPGAEDNGSGSAALLEAARILQNQSRPRTIKLIWFTGEEQGLLGSEAYTDDHDLSAVLGVINLDMYGYDSNNDGCFEIHVGRLAQSNKVGLCMARVIDAYGIPLSYDYLTTTATGRSDHYPFWQKQIGAIEILENYSNNNLPGGCIGSDPNPNYHKITDTIDKLNLPVGYNITRAALAAALSMAGEQPIIYSQYFPVISR